MSNMNNSCKLKNNVDIPFIGFGTWKVTDREIVNNVINDSFNCGYRLIDTAMVYRNEISIGKAIRDNCINRNELIICNKVWNSYRSYAGVLEAFEKSAKKFKTEYFDLFLIHWPASENIYENWKEINAETWRGMEELLIQKKVKAIGVCNFKIKQLEELRKTEKIVPMVNQIEFHPGMYNKELLDYCNKRDIKIIASSPLGNGKILENKDLIEIANRKNKTVAQICLRWIIQKGAIAIPKTTKKERMKENINVFDFSLSEEEMCKIDSIEYCGGLNINCEEELKFE